jgi:HTH-type transcriptional regulator/antitoxin HipB
LALPTKNKNRLFKSIFIEPKYPTGYIDFLHLLGYIIFIYLTGGKMKYSINTAKQLGSALRARRKIMGLTQSAAGENVGLIPKTVSALENHTEKTTVESLFKLLSALNLNIQLLSNEPESPTHTTDW